MELIKKTGILLSVLSLFQIGEAKLIIEQNERTGGLNRLTLTDGQQHLDFILRTDAAQYPWIGAQYGWGLGQFRLESGGKGTLYQWKEPVRTGNGFVVYESGPIEITVTRSLEQDELTECYSLKNKSEQSVELHELGINTPFNDNYPDAETCVRSRMNAHIWGAGSSSWVNAMRMNGKPPHLGLVVQQGKLDGYEVLARGSQTGSSNTRGVLMLNAGKMMLRPGETQAIQWKIFSHSGMQDFWNKALQAGACRAASPKYVYEQGEEIQISFDREKPWKTPKVFFNSEEVSSQASMGTLSVRTKAQRLGDIDVKVVDESGFTSHARLLVISGEKKLLSRRVGFIQNNQQLDAPGDVRDGAFMVYDNQEGKIYMNDRQSVSGFDRNEGRERLGMGVLLAMWLQQHKDDKMLRSLRKYHGFVRNHLQDPDYKTYSDANKRLHRGYNYPWIAHFYLEMYRATGEKSFLEDYYGTMKAFYRNCGYEFYAIGIPVKEGIEQLRKGGMQQEAASLLDDFVKMGRAYVQNSYRYPKHEVNYEQSIVAPSISFLCELYLITRDKIYLEEARKQMPLLEAFAGDQPSYHLNDIAIRHWDGYWFGKREMWGDVFPHYWSVLSAMAFHFYAQCSGESRYQQRAENIARNNLCLFREDGQGSCAYIYPNRVNGVPARFYDEYANDQDWALVFYLMINSCE